MVRLYRGDSAAGSIQFPNDGVSFHDRSLYYFYVYRNAAANGQPGCPGFHFGYNTTNAGAVLWSP